MSLQEHLTVADVVSTDKEFRFSKTYASLLAECVFAVVSSIVWCGLSIALYCSGIRGLLLFSWAVPPVFAVTLLARTIYSLKRREAVVVDKARGIICITGRTPVEIGSLKHISLHYRGVARGEVSWPVITLLLADNRTVKVLDAFTLGNIFIRMIRSSEGKRDEFAMAIAADGLKLAEQLAKFCERPLYEDTINA